MKYVAFVDEFVTLVDIPPVLFCQFELLVVRYHVDVSLKVMLVKLLQP